MVVLTAILIGFLYIALPYSNAAETSLRFVTWRKPVKPGSMVNLLCIGIVQDLSTVLRYFIMRKPARYLLRVVAKSVMVIC